MTWQCKKHGKNCQSYILGFCHDLNYAGVQPSDAETMSKKSKEDKAILDMVEWKENKAKKQVGKEPNTPSTKNYKPQRQKNE